MHILIFLLLSTSAVFAQETFESELNARKEQLETELQRWRASNRFQKLPNDSYVQFYSEAHQKFLEDEIKLHEKYCSRSNTNCLTETQRNQLAAQTRVAIGSLTVANRWAHEGKSDEEQRMARETYERCAREQKDCDKLPEADRRIATETPGTGSTTTTPENNNPDTNTNPNTETNTTVTVSVQDDFNAAKTKLEEELLKMREEFATKYPDANTALTPEAVTALKEMEAAKLAKTLAMFEELCKKHDGNEEVCLTEDEKKELQDQSVGNNCYYDRRFQFLNAPDKDKRTAPESSRHVEEWSALPEPKSCQTLLDKDKVITQTPETPETPVTTTDDSVNEDENSPRNYKAETCKWVSDLPRKIVNGPGCNSRSRSRMCTGYVVCEQKEGGGKFVRMSTCRAQYCGGSDEDAVRCTKDMAFFSEKPASETKMFVTPRIKNLLKGASEQ